MNKDIQTLYDMLSFKRPYGGPTEGEYINRYLRPLGVKDDKFGNLHLTIGEKPTVLWSSHTDTVHRSEGHQHIELVDGQIRLAAKSKSGCLGADCGAGNWIMMEMIKARIPGLYIFHFGEEHGQIGANKIRTETPEVLDGIKAAIAFDRRGTTSVITHQGMRTCSDAFGLSLAEQLPGFKLDDTGTVTDTKVYRGLVPECTNVSVGYRREHSPDERLDVGHIVKLRDAMLKIDASRFVIERKPEYDQGYGTRRSSFGGGSLLGGGSSFGSFFEPKTLSDLFNLYPDECAAVFEAEGVTLEVIQPLVDAERARKRALRAKPLPRLFGDEDPDDQSFTPRRKIA
jgi:hypothetical protein